MTWSGAAALRFPWGSFEHTEKGVWHVEDAHPEAASAEGDGSSLTADGRRPDELPQSRVGHLYVQAVRLFRTVQHVLAIFFAIRILHRCIHPRKNTQIINTIIRKVAE